MMVARVWWGDRLVGNITEIESVGAYQFRNSDSNTYFATLLTPCPCRCLDRTDSTVRRYAVRRRKLVGTINLRCNSRATGDFLNEFLAWRFVAHGWVMTMARRKQ